MKLASARFICVSVAAACLLSACAIRSARWSSTNPPGLYQASFEKFTGTEHNRVQARAGEILFVDANAKIKSGHLEIAVQKGSSVLWQKSFAATNDAAHAQLPIATAGEYKIRITGHEADGEFHVIYKLAPPKPIEVQISKNIELFGLILQLDLAPDALANNDVLELDGRQAQWRDWYRPAVANFQRFQAHTNAPMMQRYRDLTSRGFYNDFFIHFLLQVDEVPQAKLRPDTDQDVILAFSSSKDLAEATKAATVFLDALNRFYTEIQFESFLAENQATYDRIQADVTKNLPPATFIPAMEHFYQKTFQHYRMVPSFNIPTGMGFGKTHRTAGAIYNVFGPFTFTSLDKNPPESGFNRRANILNLSVHEFGHSFVNPAIDRLPPDLLKSTEHLFVPIKDALSKQSYPSWIIALYEHFVRAGEVIIARKLDNHAEADRILRNNATNSFIYLPAIVAQLENYDRYRHQHKSYDDFVRRALESLKAENQSPTPRKS